MKKLVGFLLCLSIFFSAACSNADKKNPLPVYQTAEEKAQEETVNLRNTHYTSPPAGSVYSPAEFSTTSGVILNIYNYSNSGTMWNYFGSLSEAVINAGARPWIIEPSQSRIDYALTNVLNPRGITSDDIDTFLVDSRLETYWVRDYAPWFIYEDNTRKMIDMQYYSTRPGADHVPFDIASAIDEDIYASQIFTEGGNFMTDGNGTCWMTTEIFERNSTLSQSDITNAFMSYIGCDSVHFITPIQYEGTGHIDMLAKVINQDTILVGYSTAALGATSGEIASLDQAASEFAATPKPDGGQWNIIRIPMAFDNWDEDEYDWGLPGRMYLTHTNSLMVNNTVIVPTYGKETDTEALQVYADALPEYNIVPINTINLIGFGGAVHCTTMQVPEPVYSTCGDGVVSDTEECEKNYLKGTTCTDLGFTGGTLGCSDTCSFDTANCDGISTCGNGQPDTGEICDGETGVTCSTLDAQWIGGTADCKADCSGYNTENCELSQPVCGNNIKEGDEVCDGTPKDCTAIDSALWESGTAACLTTCDGYDSSTCVAPPITNDCESQACVNSDQIAIPDNNATGITAFIAVENFNATLDTVQVTVNITHTYRGDLVVQLTSPAGTTATLHNKSGGGTDNLNLNLTRSDFNGENPVGNWELFVKDTYSRDTGTLDNWTIQLTADAPLLCKNGVIDEGELCDSDSMNCTDLDPNTYISGQATCNATCDGWDTTNCQAPICGNGSPELNEVCDSDEINCIDIDSDIYLSGTANCSTDCSGYDTSTCVEANVCGNDVIEATNSELCDGNSINCADLDSDNWASGTAICSSDCLSWDESDCSKSTSNDGWN